MSNLNKQCNILSKHIGIIIFASIVFAFCGTVLYLYNSLAFYVEVNGRCEKEINADYVIWKIKIETTHKDSDKMKIDRIKSRKSVVSLLKESGISEKSMDIIYETSKNQLGESVAIDVINTYVNDINLVRKINQKIQDVVQSLSNIRSEFTYVFNNVTNLGDLVKQASEDAMQKADLESESLGRKTKGLRHSSYTYNENYKGDRDFQNSNKSDNGESNSLGKRKIRVDVHAVFDIK